MKNSLFIVGMLLLVFGISEPVNAQILQGFGKKMEKKVEQQINSRVERRADKAINKGMDKVENAAEEAVKGGANKTSNTSSAPTSDAGNTRSAASSDNVTLSDTYDFTLGVTYQIQSGKDKAMETAMWFGAGDYIGMSVAQKKDMFMIIHGTNMVAFMENEKNYLVLGRGIAAGIVGAAAKEAKEDAASEQFEIRKIGTERILNYNCDVYEAKSSEYTTKLWLTSELDVRAGSLMSAFAHLAKSSSPGLPDIQKQVGGVLLKMEGKNLKDNKNMRMEATAINNQSKRINTKEYKKLGL